MAVGPQVSNSYVCRGSAGTTHAHYRPSGKFKLAKSSTVLLPASGEVDLTLLSQPPGYHGPMLLDAEEPGLVFGTRHTTPLLGYVVLTHPTAFTNGISFPGEVCTTPIIYDGFTRSATTVAELIHRLEKRERKDRKVRIKNPDDNMRKQLMRIRRAVEPLAHRYTPLFRPDSVDFDFDVDLETAPIEQIEEMFFDLVGWNHLTTQSYAYGHFTVYEYDEDGKRKRIRVSPF